MIGRLRGLIIEKTPPDVLLDVGGVGYEIQLPMTCFYQLPDIDHTTTLHTHLVVREDANLLYGFVDKEARALFRLLIKANGIGPKLACTILSGMTAGQFSQAVLEGDITALVKMPGVGKKTAERLVVELRDKVNDIQGDTETGAGAASTQVPLGAVTSAKEEALSALLALGYKRAQAEKVIDRVFVEDASSESLIREALKAMV